MLHAIYLHFESLKEKVTKAAFLKACKTFDPNDEDMVQLDLGSPLQSSPDARELVQRCEYIYAQVIHAVHTSANKEQKTNAEKDRKEQERKEAIKRERPANLLETLISTVVEQELENHNKEELMEDGMQPAWDPDQSPSEDLCAQAENLCTILRIGPAKNGPSPAIRRGPTSWAAVGAAANK